MRFFQDLLDLINKKVKMEKNLELLTTAMIQNTTKKLLNVILNGLIQLQLRLRILELQDAAKESHATLVKVTVITMMNVNMDSTVLKETEMRLFQDLSDLLMLTMALISVLIQNIKLRLPLSNILSLFTSHHLQSQQKSLVQSQLHSQLQSLVQYQFQSHVHRQSQLKNKNNAQLKFKLNILVTLVAHLARSVTLDKETAIATQTARLVLSVVKETSLSSFQDSKALRNTRVYLKARMELTSMETVTTAMILTSIGRLLNVTKTGLTQLQSKLNISVILAAQAPSLVTSDKETVTMIWTANTVLSVAKEIKVKVSQGLPVSKNTKETMPETTATTQST